MKKWIIYFFISVSILSGCQPNLQAKDKGDNEKNKPVLDVVTDFQLSTSEIAAGEQQFIYPVVITLIDPRTLQIVKSFSPQLLGFGVDDKLYQNKVEEIARKLARGTKDIPGYDQQMELDRVDVNGDIVKGNPGILLKESELVEKIIASSYKGEDIFLPLYLLESNYNAEDIPLMNDVTVASFTTYFSSSETGRSRNIELSANALDNIIVGDGDTFSFNTMVGERSVSKGYQPAPEIINKQLVMGIGGGICQTSSTLFNAVDQLGVKMKERHHHSLNIGYVPTGRDATVSYGTLDFKFQNNSGAPFLIRTFYSKNTLTIEIRTTHQYKEVLKKS
ncbi:VanW family protein [Solibacillus sp. A46]|uniref:VanW family protein n=1 Tax=Solibacillus faecavium TaxID=2762221 RepID=A0ABR8XYT5_9BACL|nr:VanW family protein [Solibacillus faecavium]MBD8036999.1 VanW family protein [Solibacillus faecavium]